MSKASALAEELDELQHAYGEVYDDATKLIDLTRRDHDDNHVGNFQWCERATCRTACDLSESYR